jgi:hypothetical protein
MSYSQKRGRENCLVCVYLRFRSAKNAAVPMTQAIATTATMAASVETRDDPVVSAGVYCVAADTAGSGSICCAADGASSTFM